MYHTEPYIARIQVTLCTLRAATAIGLYVVDEVVLSVVVGELLSCFDCALCFDMDLLLLFVYLCVAVGTTRVVDITGDVFAPSAINIEVFFKGKEIRAVTAVCFFLRNTFAGVLYNPFVLFSGNSCIETKPRACALHDDAELVLTALALLESGCFFHRVCVPSVRDSVKVVYCQYYILDT